MIEYLKTWLLLKADRRAVTALEYGVIAAAIVVAISATVFGMGNAIKNEFSNVQNAL